MRMSKCTSPIALRLSSLAFVALLALSPVSQAQNGAAISTDTEAGYSKSNQSKVFFHDGKWWAVAHRDSDNRWYIWKYSGGAWTNLTQLNKSSTLKYDALLNSSTGKLYVMGSHASSPEFYRFTYSSGTQSWTKDSGFSVNPGFVNTDAVNPASLIQAKNGDLWIFRIESSTLEAKKSTDGGTTWSSVITVKSGLTTANATTDAVAFTSSGNNYVGVAYAETDAAGSKYGFLIHQDGNPDATWSDESASLTFFGSERADNKICAASDNNNNTFIFTQNANASGSNPSNTLYKRASGGGWQKFNVNSASSLNWKSPAVVADVSANRIYVMGTNTTTEFVQYKSCIVGSEAGLSSGILTDLLSAGGATFDEISAPAPSINATSSLMVTAENTAASDIWYNLLSLSPITVGTVTVASNQVNANASYTVPITLGNIGALAAGIGTIQFTFPSNTFVPAAITPSTITVNGTPASVVTYNSATRQVTVTTPVNLADNANFPVVFNTGAGLLNPSLVGAYNLQALTSVQLTPASSPAYSLVATTTTVTPATVSPSPGEPDSCADYTITFNLGTQGGMVSGTSTFTLTFGAATTVGSGALAGVTVNSVLASATGNNTTKTVNLTLPASVTLGNNAAVSIYLPSPALCNPPAFGTYTITVATSVETAAVTSNPYNVIERVTVGDVTVAPDAVNANSSYSIPLTLAGNGALAAGVGTLTFRFPNGTTVPASIAGNTVTVDGTPAVTVVSNSVTREAQVTTPVNLPNSHNFTVVFGTAAGLLNPPTAGGYTLQAWTSVQTTHSTSPVYFLTSGTGSAISVDTQSGYRKSNQSKVFYHDSKWWALAWNAPDKQWYIWKFDGSTWTKSRSIRKSAYRWDAVMDASNAKLYLFGSHKTTPYVYRYSYAGGTWTKDSGYPVQLLDFPNTDDANPVSMVQAKNGDLWIFRVEANTLQAKRSSDGGKTWSLVTNLKSGLTTANATTDAVTFTNSADNFVGVAYGETSVAGSKFGFLLHRDGDPDATWLDESASLTFFGAEHSLNMLSMAADAGNNVYLFTRNDGGSPRNALYKRTSAGPWEKYKVNPTTGLMWKSPAIAIDATNGKIFVMGVNTSTQQGEYKTCLIGQESTLETAVVGELIIGDGAAFDDLSAPAANIDGFSGLMVTADNTAGNDIWFRHIPIGGGAPLIIGPVTVASNQINANADYSIPLTLSATGGLTADAGTIHIKFPDNTHVPDAIPPAAVLVDGVPATTVTSSSATREVSITTPVNLPNSYTFPVVFDSSAGAGVLNPTTIGAYQLGGYTSSQPIQVNSPAYSLLQTTTTVTPATVTPFPTDPDTMATYTLTFNLGAHGRLLPGASTFSVKFGPGSTITSGALSGAKVNNVVAAATADGVLRKVTLTVPASLALTNNSPVTLFIPNTAVRNPLLVGGYTLTVATSVETTAVISNLYQITPSTNVGAPIPGTTKRADRANQSKMFYHGGFWWVTGQAKTDNKWYLWKFDGISWTQSILIHSSAKNRPDCILNAAANKVYILLPGPGTTTIARMSYSGGAWSMDGGYPYNIPDFTQTSDYGINLVRAKNGELWVFTTGDSSVFAKRSTNEGQTWSARITVKDSLNNMTGLTDAVAITFSGSNYVGLGYAENSSDNTVYGFMRHKDGDPETSWFDETGDIPQFSGTSSDDHISMAVHNNEVLMIVKTNGGGPSTVNIGLLQRSTSGDWSQYPIFKSTGWTRPTLCIDESNNRLYAVGTREGTIKVGEMKNVALGDYDAFLSAPTDTIFKNEEDDFFNTSVSAHEVNGSMGLMVVNGNETRDELWYNLIPLGGAAKFGPPANGEVAAETMAFDGVRVFPNPFNPATTFAFKLKQASQVKLQIFNLNGQLVRTLIDGELQSGLHQKRWNGAGRHGVPAASGTYLYRIQIDRNVTTGRIQLLK